MYKLRFSVLTLCISLSACVTPEALRGNFAATTPSQAASSASTGNTVRWGGTLLSLSNDNAMSCIEVLGRPLDSTGRPERSDQDLGRFIACQPGFKDPEVYKTGRIVTVVGQLNGVEQRKLGSYDYRYAKLKADTVYLWQDQTPSQVIYAYDPFFNPYTYPYPYYTSATYYYYTPPPGPVAVAQPTALNNNVLGDSATRRMPAAIGNVGNIGVGGLLRR